MPPRFLSLLHLFACVSHWAVAHDLVRVRNVPSSDLVVSMMQPLPAIRFGLVTVVIAVFTTLYILTRFGCVAWKKPWVASPVRSWRSVQTQSMVTYRRDLEAPRFQVLQRPFDHGAWADVGYPSD